MAVPMDVTWAEHIAFLRLLHDTPPEKPSKNKSDHLPIRNDDYVLPFDKERRFVGACAFLSNIRTRIESIPAVCVRENHETSTLELLVAVNKRTASDGRDYLREMKSGFQGVFDALRRANIDNERDVQSRVFDAVISMCYHRILERLGVGGRRKANGKVRKPVRAELATAVDHLKTTRRSQTPRANAHEVVQGMRRVISAIDAWSNHQVLPDLRVVVDAVHDLSKVARWKTVITSISNQILSPSQREKIVNVVMKIAKYRQVARYLYHTAKKFPIARAVRVATVDLPPSAFEETRLDGFDPQVEAFFRRLHPKNLTLAGLCRRLSVSETGAQSSFHQDVEDILGVSRIHAEVQLIVYCDTELAGSKPRVICSSKAACFLCNQLIKAHGKLYTPYCHGRLYTPWRIPKLFDGRLSRQLSSTLEEFTLKSLEKIGKRSARIRYPDPSESPTHTLLSSLTTLAGPASASLEQLEGDIGIPAPAASVELPIAPDVLAAPHQPPNMSLAALKNQINSLTASPKTGSDVASDTSNARVSRRSSPEGQQSTKKLVGTAEEGGEATHRPHTVSTVPSEKVESPENAFHLRGAACSKSFPVGEGTPLRVPTDAFDLLIARVPGAGDEAKIFVCHLATLTPGAAKAVLARNDLLVVAADELDRERSLPLDQCVAAPFYISAGGCVLEVYLLEAEKTMS